MDNIAVNLFYLIAAFFCFKYSLGMFAGSILDQRNNKSYLLLSLILFFIGFVFSLLLLI